MPISITPMPPSRHRLYRDSYFDDSSEVLTANTDDFIIGDRVFVNGSKPGYIQFIGETQFAPGEWAGVVLDEPVGKNDGSVAGVRYFQCEQKRGVFARLHRITRLPMATNGTTPNSTSKSTLNSSRLSTTTSPAESVKSSKMSPSGRTTSTTTTTTTLSPGIRIGDRVMVSASSGVKTGTLRFLGTATFATGNWAGVELDDPVGKNDGSVAGKRYFECSMKHGLFAPLHKISKLGGPRSGSTTTTTKVVMNTPGNSPLHRRTGSHESLNSSMSSASSLVRAGKVRLGVKALTNTQKQTRPAALNATTTSSALQIALKEKEEHIEQLLKERDLERSEVVRAAAQVDETEQKLSSLLLETQHITDENVHIQATLQDKVESLELEKTELSLLLEDEKKKVDDFQFRMEEEEIFKSELENQCKEDKKKISDLLALIEKQRNSNNASESEKLTEADAILNTYKESVEVLSCKVNQLEETVKNLESKEFENNEKVSILESELISKEEAILQLESNLEKTKNELSNLQVRVTELESELDKSKERQSKQLGVIDGLNLELNKTESTFTSLNEAIQNMKVINADMIRQLKSSDERHEHLSIQKIKLEQQISEMMQATGDNSEQLTRMNADLREKETQVEELRGQLALKSQELEKEKDIINQMKEQTSNELKRLSEKSNEEISTSSQNLKLKELEIEKLKSQVKSLSDLISDLENKFSQKGSEALEASKKLSNKEGEMMRLNAKLQETNLQLDVLSQNSTKNSSQMEGQLIHLQMENQILQKEKEESGRQKMALEEGQKKLEEECKKLQQDKKMKDLAIIERETQLAMLTSETDRLRSAFTEHKDELERKLSETELVTKGMQELHCQLERMNDTENALKITEAERDTLLEHIASLKKINDEQESKSLKLQNELKDEIMRKSTEVSVLASEKASCKEMLRDSQVLFIKLQDDINFAKEDGETKFAKLQNEQEIEILKKTTEISGLKAEKSSIKEMYKESQLQLEELQAELVKQKISLQKKGNEDKLQYYATTVQKLEEEKKQLENKVVELQVSVARSQVNANSADPAIDDLKAEKESLTGQIEFLNSVIVDMQRKNDDLNSKLKSLENGESFDGTDLNLNGIKTVVAPRLFCDICEMFDIHDTEDCPTQSSFMDDLPHSQHRGERNTERPYCTHCEIFGHWTDNCDDNEMF